MVDTSTIIAPFGPFDKGIGIHWYVGKLWYLQKWLSTGFTGPR